MDTSALADRATVRRPAFSDVLCGVDGSSASLEAARQAALLCVPGGRLRLVAVTWETGTATSRWRADRALSEARATALDLGLDPRVSEHSVDDPVACLVGQSTGCELLAVGTRGRSRMRDSMLGSTATALLRSSNLPVLMARTPPADGFGESILLAVDGTRSCLAAADVAGRVAACTGGRVAIVSAPGHDGATREILGDAACRLRDATGSDPVILDESGAPHRAIAVAAVAVGASLIVTGRRGLTGREALDSVSERVARVAPCSVLVVRDASRGL